jgi:hypothetical protein
MQSSSPETAGIPPRRAALTGSLRKKPRDSSAFGGSSPVFGRGEDQRKMPIARGWRNLGHLLCYMKNSCRGRREDCAFVAAATRQSRRAYIFVLA